MSRESHLLWIVFAVLTTLVALPFVIHRVRTQLRPRPVAARIVTSTADDPVLRTGPRHVTDDADILIAVALRVERWGRAPGWVAPPGDLEIDGELQTGPRWMSWPENDRQVRVFWFTIECTTVGGEIGPNTAAERLEHRTFLAPEMGRDLTAAGFPSQHNDDALGPRLDGLPSDGGTARLYARVEVVDRPDAVRPLAVATTMDLSRYTEPGYPRVLRRTDLGDGIDSSAGELFRLPGFEVTGDGPPGWILPGLELSMTEATTRRLVVSSWTFAAVGVSGRSTLTPSELERLGRLTASGGRMLLDGRPAVWGRDIEPGYLVSDGAHWIIVIADDGNGELDPVDPIVHCWRSPPTRSRLGLVLDTEPGNLELYRHVD